jgi:hypothetical protein
LQVRVDLVVGHGGLVWVVLSTVFDVSQCELGLASIVHLGELIVYAAGAVEFDADLGGGPVAVLAEEGIGATAGIGLVLCREEIRIRGRLNGANLKRTNADRALVTAPRTSGQ